MSDGAAGDRIPVSLVTGFLGSGKTTLIAALLRQPEMAGSAVIVNEFGAVGIDDAIFAQSVDAENVMLLANGCLCCTSGEDLAATIWSLARRADRPRRIVIETTGLADPVPVLQRLMADPRLAQATRLDTVVATVDAVSGLKNLDDQPVAARQCAVADRRVITKSDLADPAAVAAIGQRLRAINPGADILRVDHGRIDAEKLFGASLYDPRTGRADLDRWLNAGAHRDAHGHEQRHDAHPVAAWLIEDVRRVDWEILSPKLGGIIASHGDLLLRIKGVIHTAGDPRPLVIHGVQRLFHPPVRLLQWTTSPGTHIVIIGDRAAAPAVDRIAEALSDSVGQGAIAAAHREMLTA